MKGPSPRHSLTEPGVTLAPGAGSWSAAALPHPPARNPGDGSLLELWQGFRRGKKTLLLLTLAGALAGLLAAWMQAPVYRAMAAIEIQGFNDDFLNLRNIQPTIASSGPLFRTDIPSQIRILNSRTLTQRALERLQSRQAGQTESPAPRTEGWREALRFLTPQSPIRREEAFVMARDTVQVSLSGDTRVVEIRTDSTTPRVAAGFANALAQEFIQQNVESRWQAIQDTESWLGRQLESVRERLQDSEERLQRYARESGLMFTAENGSVAEQKLRQLQEELSRAQADRIAKQSRYERALSGPPDISPDIPGVQTLVHYETQATDLRRRLAELEATYTPEHYRVRETAAQIQEVERAIERERRNVIGRIRNDYETARRRETLLREDYALQARLVSELADRSIQYTIIEREVNTNQQLYDSLLQKVKEAGIAAAMSASNVRVIDAAEVPKDPYKPSLALNVLMGSLGGLFLGGMLVFVRQQTDLTLRQPGDVAACLGLAELGVIPASPSSSRRVLLPSRGLRVRIRYVGRAQGPVVRRRPAPRILQCAAEQPNAAGCRLRDSSLAESFRATLASILHAGPGGLAPRVLVVTSASPSEGKTSVTSNLAVSFAEINHRVLVIDADLRRPRLHEVFDVSNRWGLTSLLQRKDSVHNCPFESIACETTVPGLYVLPSGPAVPNVTNLLYSRRTAELLERVRREFDTVLIDTPPVIDVADARVLGPLSDGVILVVRSASTTRGSAGESAERILRDGARLLGAVLNFWDPKQKYYSRTRSYSYPNHNPHSPADSGRAAAASST